MKGDKYDKYVGKEVILTSWDGQKNKAIIIKNDKENKRLEIPFGTLPQLEYIHYLNYENIGKGKIVTKIEFAKKNKPIKKKVNDKKKSPSKKKAEQEAKKKAAAKKKAEKEAKKKAKLEAVAKKKLNKLLRKRLS